MERVLKLCRAQYYRWLAPPVTEAELAWAHRANALFDAHRDDPAFGYRYLHEEGRPRRSRHVGPHGVADLLSERMVVDLRQEALSPAQARTAGAR